MNLYDPSDIKAIKEMFGMKFSKSLGQNFLTSRDVLLDICGAAEVGADDLVIEIGPGIGVLTKELARDAGKVVGIEIDEALIKIMEFTLNGLNNVKIIRDNILKLDLHALIEEEKGDLKNIKICGNLPYYITSPILLKLIEEYKSVKSMTCMIQKEVAERVAAGPGSKAYGALSVALQYKSDVTYIRDVPKTVFMPQPKVDSAVIRLDTLETPRVEPRDEKLFMSVIRAAFGMRRKTLANSLGSTGFDKEKIIEALERAGIDPNRRAETLSIEEFARVSDELGK